ncbi:hypothetical protein C4D60_Mb05t28380 [Musa balbisiana]|uniref:Uncharacterized protein n=1 Tax=Musa balbisiana TaxID=52838 RepID=A0A4S8JZM3_MUSBA|nr:hypothetical protein C4D60_Mb05t28380 [Musa balbisiana]
MASHGSLSTRPTNHIFLRTNTLVLTVSNFTLKLDKNAKNINSMKILCWNPLSLLPNNPEKTLIIPPNVICVVTVATLDMGLSSAL